MIILTGGNMTKRNERKFRRVDVSLNAKWNGDTSKAEAHVVNLGLGGCFVTGPSQIPIGEDAFLDVQLLNGRWVSLPVKTIYALFDRGIGVKFGYLSKEQADDILKTIDYFLESDDIDLYG
jgi:Tfp pilus assembly protein PilZ